jgi:ATP-binding cassette, subfamily C, bacteriocin exporter
MNKAYSKAFVRQHEQTDCGVACLAAAIRFFGGESAISRLREISGTSRQGTTMLGLYQAARESGLSAEAYEAEISNLEELTQPCILHVLIHGNLQHYVLCYGYTDKGFVISDPAKGVSLYSREELQSIWKSKALLLLEPEPGFRKAKDLSREKWFWVKKLVQEDMNILSIALVLGIAIAVLSLSTAVFSQRLIDDILPNSNRTKLIVGFSLLCFLLLIKTGLGYIRQTFLIMQGKDFNNRIIDHFYSRVLYLPKSFFDNRKVGELIARMNDTGRIQSSISYLFSNVMIDVLLIVVSSVFILLYSVPLGLLALSYIPLYFFIVYLYNNRIIRSQQEVMASFARNESNYVDTIQGAGVIKSMNKEPFFIHSTRRVYDFFQEKIFALGTLKTRFNLITELTGTVIILAVIGVSSFLVLDGDLKLGGMMAVLQMSGILIPAAGRLAMTNIQLQEAKVAFDRMYEFTSMQPEYDKESDSGRIVLESLEELEVKSIAFRFPGRKALLEDVSFRVCRGEMIAIVGESGCGKSTLMQVLQKFYGYENGTVTANGHDFRHLSVEAWRSRMAVVPQEIKIFNGSLIDNICLDQAGPEKAAEVLGFCRQYGFERFFMSFPMGYATVLGEGGINLSGGQQQLVALARALYRQPQLLLLDEATSAMDRNTEAWVMGLLEQIKKTMSIVFVSHRVQTARRADRIYLVENGRTKASGRHEELIEEENLYSLAWNDWNPAALQQKSLP